MASGTVCRARMGTASGTASVALTTSLTYLSTVTTMELPSHSRLRLAWKPSRNTVRISTLVGNHNLAVSIVSVTVRNYNSASYIM